MKPASGCGTSSWFTTTSGTTTSPPLINITVNGKPIRAVAQLTKQSYLFVFDRVTGAPVWPIEASKVPGGDTKGSALWQGAAWDPETNMLYVRRSPMATRTTGSRITRHRRA